MKIIQISDSHLSGDKPERAAELEACIQYINALQPQPDVVVHTGDVAHNGLIEEYVTARHLLDQLSVPYFVLAGNRDHRSNLIKVFADGRHLRPDMEFVQYSVDSFEMRLIVIDTVSESNKGCLCGTRFRQIEHMLASNATRPTLVCLHHPPFEVSVGPEPRHFTEWREAEMLIALIKRHEQVCGIVCGHVHRSFETVIDAVPASVVSSVVSDLRWDNPAGAADGQPVFKMHAVPGKLPARSGLRGHDVT